MRPGFEAVKHGVSARFETHFIRPYNHYFQVEETDDVSGTPTPLETRPCSPPQGEKLFVSSSAVAVIRAS